METNPSAHWIHADHRSPAHATSLLSYCTPTQFNLPLHTRGKLQRPINLETRMSLGCGRKRESKRNPSDHRENIQTPHRQYPMSGLHPGLWCWDSTSTTYSTVQTIKIENNCIKSLIKSIQMCVWRSENNPIDPT